MQNYQEYYLSLDFPSMQVMDKKIKPLQNSYLYLKEQFAHT